MNRLTRTPLLLGVFLVLTATLAWGPTRARELWVSEDGEVAWEGWGYLKSQNLGMHFRNIDIPLLYPTNSAAMNAGIVRLASDLYFGEARLNVEHEFTFRAVTAGLGGNSAGVGFGTTQADRPRLYDVDNIDGDGLTLVNNIDRLAVSFPIGAADIRIGRQAISWGSAWFWKPTDRFSPFSPMDIDADVKRGVDALRAEVYFGPSTSLDVVATFERHEETDRELWVHGGARFRTTIGRYDLAISAARFQFTNDANYMLGLEFTGELGDVGFRGEAALNYLPETEDWDVEGVVGADYHFPMGLTLAGELFYNGFGVGDPADYGTFLETLETDPSTPAAERIARGETFNFGRYYAGIAVTQEITPLINLTLSAIGNLQDPSAFVIAGLQWSVVANGRFSAGALVPVGEKPTITGEHLSTSEYGLSPALGYAVLKLAF